MTREHPSMQKLPDEPGVYFFVGPRKEVLYVGKATSLKDRVRSYFASDLRATRGQHMVNMVDEARKVEFRSTDSVLEALILEAKLIKELKPRYNTRDKDDKSFNYLVITTNEVYPRLLTVRGKDLSATLAALSGVSPLTTSSSYKLLRPNQPSELGDVRTTSYKLPVYGPFVHATQFKEALKLIRKIFPFYDCARPVLELREKGDRKLRFNETIGVYPGADTPPKDYVRTIRHIRNFFEGRKGQVIRSLEREMHAYAKKQQFEAAARAKRQLFALQHINDISLISRERTRRAGDAHDIRIEGYDVAHLGGKQMVGVMTVVEGGEANKKEYRTFNIRSVTKSNDPAALREVLSRRLEHTEWEFPKLIVVDGGKAQYNAARAVLKEAGIEIPIVAVTKDERHRPKSMLGSVRHRRDHAADILLANAEAHRFSLARHRNKRRAV